MTDLQPELLPDRIEDVDAVWLTAALGARFAGTRVAEVSVAEVVHGAATKLRLQLVYEAMGDVTLPAVMWAKGGWEAHSAWLAGMDTYAREARFYDLVQPLVPVISPKAYFTAYDTGGRGVILMEDLLERGASLGACTTGATPDAIARSLENLARLHARWWGRTDLGPLSWLRLPIHVDSPNTDWNRANGPEVLARYLATDRCVDIPEHVKDPARIDRAFWAEATAIGDDLPHCVLHGDTHPGNSFTDADGGAGFYDWQTLSFGPFAYDVSYNIATWLEVDDRRMHERDLLRHYLDSLRRSGLTDPPNFDDAWLAYRRYLGWGLHIWITNPVTFQSEENCRALARRLGTAAADLEFFDAWGV